MDPNLIYTVQNIYYTHSLYLKIQDMFRYDLFMNISFIMGTIVALRYVQNFVYRPTLNINVYIKHQRFY